MLLCLLGAVAAPLAGPANQAAAAEAETREAFRRGVDAFEGGRYESALRAFEEVLAADPSSDLALELRNEAGAALIVEILARRDHISTIFRKLLEIAEKADRRDVLPVEKIQEKLSIYLDRSADYESQYRAEEELIAQVGPFVVPLVVKHLADKRDNDSRVKAIRLCAKLGPDGVLPVVELLKHDDEYVRQNCAAILGHIRDFRAIPALRALTEKRGESPHVVGEAAKSLQKITGRGPESLEPSLVYAQALAQRYYDEDRSVMDNNFKEWAVWKWEAEGAKLAFRVVPHHAWNEEVAEQVCYDGIRHASNAANAREQDLDALWTTLISVYFAEHVEAEALLEVGEIKAKQGRIDPTEVETLKAAKGKLEAVRALCSARGDGQLGKALRKALEERRVLIAVAMIETLRDMPMEDGLLPAEGSNLQGYIRPPTAGPGLTQPPGAAPAPAPAPAPTPRPAAAPASPQPAPAPAPQPQPQPREEPRPAPAPTPKPADPEEPRRPPRRVSDATPGTPPGAYDPGHELAGSGSGRIEVVEVPDPILEVLQDARPARTLQSSGEAWCASLAAALSYDDKRVRYAAAEALLRLAPARKFADSRKVVTELAAALGETGSRVVLVVARDDQIRNRLVGILRKLNHLAFAVPSAREGIVRARSFPAEDLVIIHTELNEGGRADDFEVAEFMKQMEADYRTAGTPVFVATPRKEIETREKTLGDKAKAILPEEVDEIVLKDKIDALFPPDDVGRDPKTKAIQVARAAAEALAGSDPRVSVFPLNEAIPALIATLETQPNVVRIPAMRALGKLRAREAVDKLLLVFDEKSNPQDVRIAAAYALGECLRGAGPIPEKVYTSLRDALGEGDTVLFDAVAKALGKAQLSREQWREVFEQQRIE